MRVHVTLADVYHLRVLGAKEDNNEHYIHHLTKALEAFSLEGPASTTDHFGEGPLDGHGRTWSELMTELGISYRKRVKVS
jgi:hypothetical protein